MSKAYGRAGKAYNIAEAQIVLALRQGVPVLENALKAYREMIERIAGGSNSIFSSGILEPYINDAGQLRLPYTIYRLPAGDRSSETIETNVKLHRRDSERYLQDLLERFQKVPTDELKNTDKKVG